jgi:signal transduction histidine kinase
MLRVLLDHASDGVLTLRASGDVGLWNRAGGAITGRRRRDLVRSGPAALFRDAGEFERLSGELQERGRLEPRETVLLRASGEEVPVRLYGLRLPSNATSDPRRPDPDRLLLFFHDLTEVHRIRRRLIETENLSAMAKIAGSVAHEFRNPLNSLFLSADLLEDELAGSGPLEEAIAPTLTAIREEVERLNQIITHYLSLSKIASNAPEVVDLGDLVQEFAREWRERAGERGVDLRVRIADGDSAVSVDPNQIRRVLVNLVENAFDAVGGEDDGETEEGGEAATERRGGIVTLAVRPMRRSVKVIVRDNGPGIPPEIRERVFEPFFTSKSSGSGLGLYLVREIVLAHGGAISLSANGGRGTSVTTRWPRADARGTAAGRTEERPK